MKAIVCADRNWGIGRGNGMLFHIPADLKYFKEKTMGCTIVMGYATFLSLPGSKALPGRRNVVLCDIDGWSAPDVTVCRNFDELFSLLGEDTENVFVTGGQSVYEQLIDYCDTAYVTRVDDAGEAEKFFPNLDERDGWRLADRSEKQESNGYTFTFDTHKKQP